MKLKIGTYNVCHCGDYENRKETDPKFVTAINMENTARTIKNLGLDIIGLNEVYDEGKIPERVQQTEKVAALAGYEYCVFAKGETYSWVTIGNAVMSHYPIINVEKITVAKPPVEERIPKEAWWEDRVLLIVDIDVKGQIIRIIESHFGLNPPELKNIVKETCKIIDNSPYPVVLMGDLNVLSDNPELNCIYERLTSVAKETGNKEFTFASYDPQCQIDYIFVPKTAKVISSTVHKVMTSDHRPLTAEIEL
jgi:endonuclease/exonuclease/phosphatase family metal-dependent hydrolase